MYVCEALFQINIITYIGVDILIFSLKLRRKSNGQAFKNNYVHTSKRVYQPLMARNKIIIRSLYSEGLTFNKSNSIEKII